MFLQLQTGNAKLGKGAATTYAPIRQSCPSSCSLRGSGCYGQSGPVAIHGARLEAQCDGLSAETVAILESAEIADHGRRQQRTGSSQPLRLHTFGDCRTVSAAVHMADACDEWQGPVWTYTHAWRDIPRAAWGRVSVLASCETLSDAKDALATGYAAAIVVSEHPASGRAYEVGGVRVVPCPEQTRGRTCVECRMCWDDEGLRDRATVVAFAAHGSGRRRALNVINGKGR
jgi:hypothetical protein